MSNAPGMGALGADSGSEPKYLRYERRGLWGQASYNIGYSYFGGLAVGGLIGMVNGLRAAPNSTPRVLLNSVLNGSGKLGARVGNAAGVASLLYTGETAGIPLHHCCALVVGVAAAVAIDAGQIAFTGARRPLCCDIALCARPAPPPPHAPRSVGAPG